MYMIYIRICYVSNLLVNLHSIPRYYTRFVVYLTMVKGYKKGILLESFLIVNI